MSRGSDHRLCDAEHPGGAEPHCLRCDEAWPCEMIRLRERVRLLEAELAVTAADRGAARDADSRTLAEKVGVVSGSRTNRSQTGDVGV